MLVERLVLLFWVMANSIPILIKILSRLTASGRLNSLLTWGKTLESDEGSWLLVPHRYFTHFYVTGLVFNTLCLLDLLFNSSLVLTLLDPVESVISSILLPLGVLQDKFELDSDQPWLPSLLLELQLTRRLLESVFVTRHDTSKMHVAHLLFALSYYPALSLSINISAVPVSTLVSVLAVVLFLWASAHQYRCHVILAELRADTRGALHTNMRRTLHADTRGGYGLPRGDWFEVVSSPHYLAEILVYIALLASSGGGYLLALNTSYQLINFTLICTPATHAWYLRKFEDYPKNRKILIPYVF